MDTEELLRTIASGENEYVEFKRCGNHPETDVFESICAFANGFGGTVFLGVEDDGTIEGIDPTNILDITRNIHNVINNPNTFDVPIAIEVERIEVNERQILKINVPNSSQVHSCKGKVFVRKGDSDTVIRGSIPLAELYIRKQNIFTERRIFEHVTLHDLRSDLIQDARQFANVNRKDHPWTKMNDKELLESAGFFAKDYVTGQKGYTLAAVLAFGKDEVIHAVCPTYKTDSLVRITDKSRYDDRLTVAANLVDSYRALTEFCRKHLPDRFTMDGDYARSPRDTIIRELVVNCLIHREFTSPFPAKIVIDSDGIHTENASRASFEGPLEPNAFAPLPKNPIIASFFSHIGLAEELGSGTREIYRCSHLYTGRDPELEEGTVFKAFVPSVPDNEDTRNTLAEADDPTALALRLAGRPEGLKTKDLIGSGRAPRTAQRIIRNLVEKGQLKTEGNGPSRIYRLP